MSASLGERDVAALTLLTLFRRSVVGRSQRVIVLAMRHLGLTHGDLVRAEQMWSESWRPGGDPAPAPASINRQDRRHTRRRPDKGRVCASDLCSKVVPGARTSSPFCSRDCQDDQFARDRSMVETGQSGETRHCRKCDTDLPVEAFRLTSGGRNADGSPRWKLKSWCIPCERGYQQTRYVSTRALEDLNALGVAFVAGEAEARLVCTSCGHRIRPGDLVHGEVSLAHAEVCPAPVLAAHPA